MTTPRDYVEKELNDEPPLGSELGSSFRFDDLFGGYEDGKVLAVPDPQFTDYKEMLETDGKAFSIEQMLSYPIISAPWEIDAALNDDGSTDSGGQADTIRQAIYDGLTDLPHQGGPRTTIEQLISQMTMAFTHKTQVFEKVFKLRDDNTIGYDKLAWRPLETVEIAYDAKNSDLRGFYQTPVRWDGKPQINPFGDRIWVPMERAFIYVHGTWRDPLFGMSSMRVPYWCYITKRKLRWLWYQFLDQTYLPKTIVKNPDDRQAVADAKKVATLRSKGVVGLRTDTTVDAYESSGKGAQGYIEAIRFLNSEMSDSILAGFMDLSSQAAEGKGSYALAESASKLFLRNRRMVARDMARQITNSVVSDLVRYNYGTKAPCPRFAFGPLSEQNEQTVLDMFKAISTTGANVDPEFYDELQVRVATLLELDPGKVKKSMEEGVDTPGGLQEMAAKVGVATEMVAGAQERGLVPQSPIGPPPGGTKSSSTKGKSTSSKKSYGEESVANGGKKK